MIIITNSISLSDCLFKLSVASLFCCGRLYVSEICLLFLGCPICWHIVHSVLRIFVSHGAGCHFSFSFLILLIFVFFAWWASKRFINFCYLFKIRPFVSFFLFKKCSILLFHFDLTMLLLFFTLGFVLYFLILLSGMLGCIFKIFLFLEESLYCYKLPS